MKRVIKIADKESGSDVEGESSLDGKRVVYTQTRCVDVPADTLRQNRIISGIDNDTATAAYKMLRTQVLRRMVAQKWTSLAVTSTRAGEGKTLTGINLAISLAREVNHTVLLVDADLRRPSIHHYFGYVPEFGLSDYLLSDIQLSEILFNPGIERLVVLPGGNPMFNSSESLSAPKMVRLAEELKTRYPARLVLFDLPPLLTTDDALAFSPCVDAFLLVVEEGKSRREDVVEAMDILGDKKIIGTVLNKSENSSYGY